MKKKELIEENDNEFYKKKFAEASIYCMRMIEATNEGSYSLPKDLESRLAYLDVVSENCANEIRRTKNINRLLLMIVIPEVIVLGFAIIKYLF